MSFSNGKTYFLIWKLNEKLEPFLFKIYTPYFWTSPHKTDRLISYDKKTYLILEGFVYGRLEVDCVSWLLPVDKSSWEKWNFLDYSRLPIIDFSKPFFEGAKLNRMKRVPKVWNLKLHDWELAL